MNLLPTFHMRCNLISSENNKKYVYNILYEIGSVIFFTFRFNLFCLVKQIHLILVRSVTVGPVRCEKELHTSISIRRKRNLLDKLL